MSDRAAAGGQPPAIAAWVEADRHTDLAVMAEQLSPDAVLVSPLTDAFRFEGRPAVMGVFEAAFEPLRDIEIVRVTGAGDDGVVHGQQTLAGENLEEVQWLRLGPDGLIAEVTLFIRPLPAVARMLSVIGPGLADRGVLPPQAGVASKAAAPLALITGLVERHVMPRVGPR
ncbi:nuclear transport factor 2 family protein [Aestuariimicrobium ganziense]|uniref:nuclear transport factor 2 family protein n=1 Tax=Aestuariimicrobium ganziense TaxID=2773677 RepID=UPI0019452EC5|nr:nuclear transport factor 2 family protein [Aestuariimicrobium ganziense]